REQEVAGKEQPERSDIEPDLPDARRVIGSPAAGEIVAIDGSDDDDKPFEPHTYVYDCRHEAGNGKVAAHLEEPEDLRREYVTAHHQVVSPAVGAEDIDAVLSKCPVLEFILAIPGDEQLCQVGDTYDRTREYDNLVHHFDMFHGDIFFQLQHLTADEEQGLHH